MKDEKMSNLMSEGITICPYCGKKYKKVDEHTWEPDCDCHDKPIQIHMG